MTPQVNLRVPDDLKAEWEGFVEESSKYQNLSELIRHSVNAEAREVQKGENGSDVDLEPIHDRLAALEDALQTVEKTVERNHGILAELREDVRESRPDVEAVKGMLYDELPAFSTRQTDDERGFMHSRFAQAERQGHGMLGDPQKLANDLSIPIGVVEEALSEMKDETARVDSVEYGGGERFYVRE